MQICAFVISYARAPKPGGVGSNTLWYVPLSSPEQFNSPKVTQGYATTIAPKEKLSTILSGYVKPQKPRNSFFESGAQEMTGMQNKLDVRD